MDSFVQDVIDRLKSTIYIDGELPQKGTIALLEMTTIVKGMIIPQIYNINEKLRFLANRKARLDAISEELTTLNEDTQLTNKYSQVIRDAQETDAFGISDTMDQIYTHINFTLDNVLSKLRENTREIREIEDNILQLSDSLEFYKVAKVTITELENLIEI